MNEALNRNYIKNTMAGLFTLDGLYNGVYDETAAAAIAPILNLEVGGQLFCEMKNYTSLRAWHDDRWYGKYILIHFINLIDDSMSVER